MATLLGARDKANESFLAWRNKKNEEQRRRLMEEKQKETKRQDEIVRKIEAGKLAYQRWLTARREADKEIIKEKTRNRLREKLCREEENKRREEAEMHYQLWRKRKDVELKFKLECERSQKKMQPVVRGYCSVWSCDRELANIMLRKVKRPSSYSLQDLSSYEMFR